MLKRLIGQAARTISRWVASVDKQRQEVAWIALILTLALAACGEGVKPSPTLVRTTPSPDVPSTIAAAVQATIQISLRETAEASKQTATAVALATNSATLRPTPTHTPQSEARVLTICLGAEPDTLYKYGGTMWVQRNILEAVYDGPIDQNTFAYQPVILEKLPSLADRDAVIQSVPAQAGDLIVDAQDEIVLLTEGVRYRPTGCREVGCSLVYSGEGLVEMDQMMVTFRILPGLKWSDGFPLTAMDSVYSFHLDADADTPSDKFDVDHTYAYQALDEQTVQWTGLPGYLDPTYYLRVWQPLPEHVWGKYTAAELVEAEVSARKPLGWGAYVIDKWESGQYIRLRRNPYYFRAEQGLPWFDEVIFRFVGDDSPNNIAALLSGECDLVDLDAQLDDATAELLELDKQGLVNAQVDTGTTWEHLDFNLRPQAGAGFAAWDTDGDGLGPFGDVRLRQAIAFCLDRQAVVDEVLFDRSPVLDTYLPPEHPMFNPQAVHYDFDVATAASLLDEIGWIDSDGDPLTPRTAQGVKGVPDGTLLEFSYETTEAVQRQQVSQILAESMAQCGIKANLAYYPASEWFAEGPDGKLFGRRFDLSQFAWLTGAEPPCDLFTTENIPGPPEALDAQGNSLYPKGWGGQNETGYSNSEYDSVCREAKMTLMDEAGYQENHLRAQEIFAVDLPVVPLYLRIKVTAARPDLCGFWMDPTAPSDTWNIEAYSIGQECR